MTRHVDTEVKRGSAPSEHVRLHNFRVQGGLIIKPYLSTEWMGVFSKGALFEFNPFDVLSYEKYYS